jgi:hypothetical protein
MTRLLPWVFGGIHVVFAAVVYPALPPRIPTHLDFNGLVTSTSATSWWSWFALPMVSVATTGLLAAIAAYLPRNPSLFNFPDKARFLALPAEYQPPVVAVMRTTLDLTASGVAITMGLVQLLLWRAAFGRVPQNMQVVLLLLTLLLGPAILLSVTRVSAAVETAERRLRDRGAPRTGPAK